MIGAQSPSARASHMSNVQRDTRRIMVLITCVEIRLTPLLLNLLSTFVAKVKSKLGKIFRYPAMIVL